jgi:hypothetical protein
MFVRRSLLESIVCSAAQFLRAHLEVEANLVLGFHVGTTNGTNQPTNARKGSHRVPQTGWRINEMSRT